MRNPENLTVLDWTEEEIANFAKQTAEPQPEPTEHLIRAMRDAAHPQVRKDEDAP